jgi:hypothetical protein
MQLLVDGRVVAWLISQTVYQLASHLINKLYTETYTNIISTSHSH